MPRPAVARTAVELDGGEVVAVQSVASLGADRPLHPPRNGLGGIQVGRLVPVVLRDRRDQRQRRRHDLDDLLVRRHLAHRHAAEVHVARQDDDGVRGAVERGEQVRVLREVGQPVVGEPALPARRAREQQLADDEAAGRRQAGGPGADRLEVVGRHEPGAALRVGVAIGAGVGDEHRQAVHLDGRGPRRHGPLERAVQVVGGGPPRLAQRLVEARGDRRGPVRGVVPVVVVIRREQVGAVGEQVVEPGSLGPRREVDLDQAPPDLVVGRRRHDRPEGRRVEVHLVAAQDLDVRPGSAGQQRVRAAHGAAAVGLAGEARAEQDRERPVRQPGQAVRQGRRGGRREHPARGRSSIRCRLRVARPASDTRAYWTVWLPPGRCRPSRDGGRAPPAATTSRVAGSVGLSRAATHMSPGRRLPRPGSGGGSRRAPRAGRRGRRGRACAGWKLIERSPRSTVCATSLSPAVERSARIGGHRYAGRDMTRLPDDLAGQLRPGRRRSRSSRSAWRCTSRR